MTTVAPKPKLYFRGTVKNKQGSSMKIEAGTVAEGIKYAFHYCEPELRAGLLMKLLEIDMKLKAKGI